MQEETGGRRMTFGQALENLKLGSKVARKGWNGKGMFIYLVDGREVLNSALRGEAFEHVAPLSEPCDDVKIQSHIDMKASDGSIVVGWLASQTDMLAEDWDIII